MFSSSRYKGKRKAAGDRSRRFHVRIFYTTNLYLPTGNLDSHSTDDIMRLLRELHRQGNTLVLITHDNEIAAQAPRRVRLLDGKVVSDSGNVLVYDGKGGGQA